MEAIYLDKYFNNTLTNLSKHLKDPDLQVAEKEMLKTRIELINELKENLDWQIKYPRQKQALRIQNLAKMRRAEALPKVIKKQESVINFYELINNVLPYIEALHLGNSTKQLLNFCEFYLDKIDFAGSNYNGKLPDSEEIEIAFKSYFVNIAISKNDMFNECYGKIECVYKELKSISDNG